MEFGIYNDGILFDNKQKKSLYFYYEENRVDEIKTSEPIFDNFKMSKISTNLDKDEFSKLVEKAKNTSMTEMSFKLYYHENFHLKHMVII